MKIQLIQILNPRFLFVLFFWTLSGSVSESTPPSLNSPSELSSQGLFKKRRLDSSHLRQGSSEESLDPTSPVVRSSGYDFSSLPVQEGGRLKPLWTVAQESLQLIHGKSTFKGQVALEVFITWVLAPTSWFDVNIISIEHLGLKKALELDLGQKYFSLEEIVGNPRFSVLLSDLKVQKERGQRLNVYYQAVSRLQSQILTFHGVQQGALRIFPGSQSGGTWVPLRDLDKSIKKLFFRTMGMYSKSFTDSKKRGDSPSLWKAHLQESVDQFVSLARSKGVEYPSPLWLKWEVRYQKWKPFFWSWVFYFTGVLFFILSKGVLPSLFFSLRWRSRWAFLGFLAMGVGFAFHTGGFILRCLIAGRPPVSNMYETVVWVAWGVVVLATLFSYLGRSLILSLLGSLVAAFCLLVADFSPVILDSSLQPLEPVLRSRLWLIVHVMTITSSYAAFFIALGVGDWGLFLSMRDSKRFASSITDLSRDCYRLIQVGVVLLAAGTILGGVWADESWGRFWGWDPKETWAFITLMGYLALLHGRLSGWVGRLGLLVGSVTGFSLVIMAWYGVNFVLGQGLHSYGFGAGGLEYVLGFVSLHGLYLGWFFLKN